MVDNKMCVGIHFDKKKDTDVAKKIYVELKSLLELSKGDEVQLVNYLAATKTEIRALN